MTGANATPHVDDESVLDEARRVFDLEISALRLVQSRLDGDFATAVNMLLTADGKIVFTGVGKSGLVAQKLAASFSSTGMPSVFINGSEAMHGDLGVYRPGDPTVMLSKSGASSSLLRLIPSLRSLNSPTIGIVGNSRSPLAEAVDVALNAEVPREADPLDVVPTSSSTVALVVGHAMLSAIMRARGFTRAQFAALHPAGLLGVALSLRVADVMHSGDSVATVGADHPVKSVIVEMSLRNLGAACVVDGDGRLSGVVTDGDVRRMLQSHDDFRPLTAASVMTRSPVTVGPDVPLEDALRLMEDRPSQISVLPVVDAQGTSLGLVRLHDILQAETP